MTDQAERARLRRALETGPWRRAAQDRRLGLGVQRGDVWQARQYTRLIEALERGQDDDVVGAEPLLDDFGTDVLALDRIEHSG